MPDYITEHHGGGWKYQFAVPVALRPMFGGKAIIARYIPRMTRRDAVDIAREWVVMDKAAIAACRAATEEQRRQIVDFGGFGAFQGGLINETSLSGGGKTWIEPLTPEEERHNEIFLKAVRPIKWFAESLIPVKFDTSWDRLFSEWQRARTPTHPRKQATTIRMLNDHFGELDCRKITPLQIAEFRDKVLVPNTTPATVVARLAHVKAIFAGASLEPSSPFHGMLNPAAGIKLLGARPLEVKPLPYSPHQVRHIFATAVANRFGDGRKKRHVPTMLMLKLLAYTGARPNEIGQLQAGDVVEEQGVRGLRIQETDAVTGLYHPQKSVKTGYARFVPLHDAVLDFYDYAKGFAENTFIFGCFKWNKDNGRAANLVTSFPRFLKKDCEIIATDPTKKYVLYSFRHTFVGALNRNRVEEIQIKKLVGHKQNITGGYSPDDFPLLREIVNALKIVE